MDTIVIVINCIKTFCFVKYTDYLCNQNIQNVNNMENEQIITVMENEHLSASQLAECLGIQRPVISHLINNRNKVSLEIVKKIHRSFPHISLAWLIDKEGDYLVAGIDSCLEASGMSSDNGSPADSADETISVSDYGSLFDALPTRMPSDHRYSSQADAAAVSAMPQPSKMEFGQAENAKNATNPPADAFFSSQEGGNRPFEEVNIIANQNADCKKEPVRKIVEIKVFYDDGTYETFLRQ